MTIVDSQVHVWDRDRDGRHWIPGGIAFAHRGENAFLPEELAQFMDGAGIDAALLVSPTWEGYRNDLVVSAATEHPDRFGAIARVELDKKDTGELRDLWANPGVYGARAVFARVTATYLEDRTVDWLWEWAEGAQMPLMVYAPGQTALLRRVAEEHPHLRLTICHLNLPYTAEPSEIEHPLAETLRLADLPNVAVKASVLPRFSATGYPFADLVPVIRRTIQAFGPERTFWGSDFTGLSLEGRSSASYAEAAALFTELFPYENDRERSLVLGDAIQSWFGIDFTQRGAAA